MSGSATLAEPGKPTIFIWGDGTEKFGARADHAIDVVARHDRLVDEAYAVVRAGHIGASSVQVFRDGLTDRARPVWEEAGKWVMQFTHYFPEFGAMLRDLMADNRAQVRLQLVQSFWNYPPTDEVITTVLGLGLKDRSKQVRNFSVSRIRMYKRKDMVPLLRTRLDEESEPAIREVLEEAIAIFMNGYHATPVGEGDSQCSIVFDTDDGSTSFFMDKTQVAHEAILARIAELRAK